MHCMICCEYAPIGGYRWSLSRSFIWHCVFGTTFVFIAGFLSHYIYQWSHCNETVGLFFAVNESVFEHVKILVLPLLLFWMIDCLSFRRSVYQHVMSAAAAVFWGLLVLNVVYITALEGFNYEETWFDILLFGVSAFFAQLAGWIYAELPDSPNLCTVLTVSCSLVVVVFCHVYFTVYPPAVELLFQDPRGFYGMPETCYAIDFPSLTGETNTSTVISGSISQAV